MRHIEHVERLLSAPLSVLSGLLRLDKKKKSLTNNNTQATFVM